MLCPLYGSQINSYEPRVPRTTQQTHCVLCDLQCSIVVVDHDRFHEYLHVMLASQSAMHDKVMR